MASDGARKQFWKRSNSKVPGSIQHVYGAQHPPFDPLSHGTPGKAAPPAPATPLKAKRPSTFQEFESSTSDAWDAGEDEDELLAMAAESLNTEVVMETAHRVLRNHSQRQERPPPREAPQPRAEPALAPAPGGDLRLVKSVSESHTPCPAESASDTVPLQRSRSLPHSAAGALGGTSDPSTLGSSASSDREASRLDKFRQLITGPHTDLEELRKLSWSGIPKAVRPITWKLLSGYLPANADRRPATLQRKQTEYFAFIERYYDSRNDEAHQDTFRQIHIDIPRMSPEALLLQPGVTEIFERILFIWAIRHPASGYVQGINDLVTPFFVVFICEHIEEDDADAADVSRVPADALHSVEADTFWCVSRLLDGIQDNYTFAQPGIQMKVRMLEELVSRIDEHVHRHLERHEVRYLQFAFRWMNNLLTRELPLRCAVRLWDTYQAEPEGFSRFHLYVCAAFLLSWRKEILEEGDFQELLLFLQNLPTAHWGDGDVSLLLAEAYRLKFAFADAPSHYKK
ncbi:TBC1 domain family member 22A isoform X1 [Rousettus aegyptiacus]|uniref:TBC1 domain family member 22A n=4 Tax=Rousettus aegyptiacus TaxID=9407 RepID=A0A7J8JNN1_ROUAE|nr:TBC1 domain family member 22A isoform X1 [Rousettus aegyptiacus]KAF6498131.1 TBC1 domain family member 22A [Rousettus aegyptiacus]